MTRYLMLFVIMIALSHCTSVKYNETECGSLPSDTFWSGNVALQCQEYRRLQAETAYRTEVANMLKSYRECVNKHSGSAAEAKEHCSAYTQLVNDPSSVSRPQK
ncbi:MAG TPA: hypothetical protein VFQ06_10210 [Nitrospira sp.]|jgi:hypothetical protein|nr:hypothetical protein [Nitrospira sp.]